MVITITCGRFTHTVGNKIGSCDPFSSWYIRSCLSSLITFLYHSPYSRHLKNKTDFNQDSSKYQNCMLRLYYYYGTVVRTQKFPFQTVWTWGFAQNHREERPRGSKQRLASRFLKNYSIKVALRVVLHISKAIKTNWSAAHEHLHVPGPLTQDKHIIL